MFNLTVSPPGMGMGARKSLQAGRIPHRDVPDNYCVSVSAGAPELSGERPFTGDERNET